MKKYDGITIRDKRWYEFTDPLNRESSDLASYLTLGKAERQGDKILFRPTPGLPDQDETVARVEYLMRKREGILSRLLDDPSVDSSLSGIDRVSIQTSVDVSDVINYWFDLLNQHGKIIDSGEFPDFAF